MTGDGDSARRCSQDGDPAPDFEGRRHVLPSPWCPSEHHPNSGA